MQVFKEDGSEMSHERGNYTINGGKILVFGDLHFSSTFNGQHKSYLEDCYVVMSIILQHVKKEKPSGIVFLGDLCGVSERNIRDRQFLTRVLMFFGTLYNLTKGNVFSVKGNHDMGDFSDFDMLISLGYIKNPKYVDYKCDDSTTEIRFHFVNYGDEFKKLDFEQSGASNVVLGHADYYIEGVTTWYSPQSQVELKKLKNFNGVDIVISGHIHIPSQEMLYTLLPNGESVGLFYPGNPTRVKERFNDCWYVVFEYDKKQGSTGYDALLMGLSPAEEVFYDKDVYIDSEDLEESEEDKHTKALDVIIQEVMESRIVTGDLIKQIDIIPGSEEEKKIAKKYVRKAMDMEV